MNVWNHIFKRPGIWLGTAALVVGGVLVGQAAWMDKDPGEERASIAVPESEIPTTLTQSPISSNDDYEENPIEPFSREQLIAEDDALAELVARVTAAVVRVEVPVNGAVSPFAPSGGSGSGFVFRSDGWIITNDHVVGASETVNVTLNNGRTYEGQVRRSNDSTVDIAVIKIDATGLSSLPLGDIEDIRPGMRAIAIGSPFGDQLMNSVSVGYVSGLGRTSQVFDPRGSRGYTALIQTDAVINPGNSGGPLINIRGEVIGVNTAIASRTGVYSGVGFAIPSPIVEKAGEILIREGRLDRAFLGIIPEDLMPYEREEMNVSGGAIVREVSPDSPAAQAGLEEGDIIVGINDQEVTNEIDLRTALYGVSAGSEIDVALIRNGQRRSLDVELGELPPNARLDNGDQQSRQMVPGLPEGQQIPEELLERFPELGEQFRVPQPDTDEPVQFGVMIEDLTNQNREQFGIPGDVREGAVVMSVTPGSFADRYDLQPGDIIVRIGDDEIETADDVRATMADVEWGDRRTFTVVRPGDEQPLRFSVRFEQ
ncbi:MAG: trypsin-like peptidase domain-containing protein [Fimbriimonadaceae bacterium]